MRFSASVVSALTILGSVLGVNGIEERNGQLGRLLPSKINGKAGVPFVRARTTSSREVDHLYHFVQKDYLDHFADVGGLTPDQQNALDLHNAARAAVGSPPLTWDKDLTASAQVWANHLTTVGGLQHDPNPGNQGENLAARWGGDNVFYASGVQLWLNEKPLYDNQPIRVDGSPNYRDYGHYTQAVWNTTTKVGMAIATSNGATYLVARYSPPGN
ncbi:Ectin [Colletotrichum chlorophyti]|uniref:Ectin n=1 Tax=Colletotrichum chlorophyti TaxID=708187 RepID=A0A1Q8S934_9PEZI|nr:Ectin [Colletotrichum chlorophyti]